VSYNLLAVDFMSPEAMLIALTSVSAGLVASQLQPLPLVGHSMSAATTALRQMSQARHVGKVVVRQPPPQTKAALGGSWLVTGGAGALGTLVSQWLLHQRLRHLALVSRTGTFTAASAAALLSVVHTAAVTLSKADASVGSDMHAVLEAAVPSVTGVMHAGGVLADATVANQTLAGIRAVFAPKAAGWRRMDAGLSVQPMHSSILFSSVAALLGSSGQLNYSIANSWLDAAAAGKQAAGAQVLSVQFGAWKGAGMAADSAAKMEAIGLGALTPSTGLQGLHGLLLGSSAQLGIPAGLRLAPQVALAPVDWPVFLQGVPQDVPFYFSAFAHLKAAASQQEEAPRSGQKAALAAVSAAAGMSDEERLVYVAAEVEAAAKAIIGGSINVSEPLMAAGLDSLGAVELRNSLEGRLGLQLPSTLVFDYPTVAAIAGFISTSLGASEPAAEATSDADVPAASSLDLAVSGSSGASGLLSVTGMATRSPGGALEAPIMPDAMAAIPTSRWGADVQLTQDMPARFGAFLSGAFLFDAAAFSIASPGKWMGVFSKAMVA
jgi:hypothetical protein